MEFSGIKSKYLILVLFFLIPFISNVYLTIENNNSTIYYKREGNLEIRPSQLGDNFTINSFFPKILWIEGQLILNISSNQTGQIYCQFSEVTGRAGFSNVNLSVDLIGNNISQTIKIISRPNILTLPGMYQFVLNITGLHTFSESFEAILIMGYGLLIITSIIIIVSLIIVLTRPGKTKEEELKLATPSEHGSLSVSTAPAGKIKCPECHKTIDEGLTFCPECGARIPEFLRYNPTSSGI